MEMNMVLREIEAECPSFEPPSLRANFNAFPDVNGLKEFVSVEPAADYTVEAVDDWEGNAGSCCGGISSRATSTR